MENFDSKNFNVKLLAYKTNNFLKKFVNKINIYLENNFLNQKKNFEKLDKLINILHENFNKFENQRKTISK